MKKNILAIFVATVGFLGHSQENCSRFYPLIQGATYEYSNANGKGKPDGTTVYTISEVIPTPDGTQAIFDLRFRDKREKDVYDTQYQVVCDGNILRIAYNTLMPSQMMEQYTNMGIDMDITGTDIELPNDLSVGQDLADAEIRMSINMNGIGMNMAVNQTGRKVEKKETVTTPAGTFDCFVVTQKTISTMMGTNQEVDSRLWLAEGVGMIKQESYRPNGSLTHSTVLEKFTK